MKGCSFCKIIKGDLPSNKIYENNNVYVFAPLKDAIISKGHMLIIPKKHYENIYEMPKKEIGYVMTTTKDIAEKLKEKYKAKGINLLHASGKAAQQSVLHFHIHLIPRYEEDGLDTWPNTGYEENNYEEVYKEIKAIVSSKNPSKHKLRALLKKIFQSFFSRPLFESLFSEHS